MMRTTLNIDDDLLFAVKELARTEKTSIGNIISRLARRGLSANLENKRGITYRNGVPLLPSRGRVITNEVIDKIREEEGI